MSKMPREPQLDRGTEPNLDEPCPMLVVAAKELGNPALAELTLGEINRLSKESAETLKGRRDAWRLLATALQDRISLEVRTTALTGTVEGALMRTKAHTLRHPETIAQILDLLAASKSANEAPEAGEKEPEPGLTDAKFHTAHEALQGALQGATPKTDRPEAVARYSLACALIALGHVAIDDESSITFILTPGNSIPRADYVSDAISQLSQFLGFGDSTLALKVALGQRQEPRPNGAGPKQGERVTERLLQKISFNSSTIESVAARDASA